MSGTNPHPNPVPAPTDCRLVTYNVLYDGVNAEGGTWEKRQGWVVDELERLQPDIIAFQEVWQTQFSDLQAALPEFSFIGTADGREHTPIAYRREQFELEKWGTFWLSGPDTEPGVPGWDGAVQRLVTYATLRHQNAKRDLTVYSVHLDHVGTQARLNGMELVREQVPDTGAAVVAGDFNCQPDSPAYELAIADKAGLRPLFDTATIATSVTGPEETYIGFTPEDEPVNIDHIFVTDELAVERVVTCLPPAEETRQPSDHRPVVADLQY